MTRASLRPLVVQVLAAVADGRVPDWALLEAAARTPSDRADLVALRSLTRVCEGFRLKAGLDPQS